MVQGRISDGNIGYVENKRLAAAESQKFSGNFTAPVYKNTSMSGKIVLGWHQVTSQDGNNTFDSILAKTKRDERDLPDMVFPDRQQRKL